MLRVSLWLCAFASVTGFCAEAPSGDSVIRAAAGGSEIVISTTARLAGAIDSLSWNGREFINSTDHGRQLQSASNLDSGTPILNETYNPTEAGCERDGAGPVSSSRLLHLVATGNALQTTSQMAFWLRPGGKSGGQLAKNNTVLSNHLLTKRVRIGYKEMPGVISYDVTFGLPIGERHNEAVFEALTGYMPTEFSRFLQFNAQSGELEPLSEGPGEIGRPVVLSVPGGSHAMGIYSPPQNSPATSGPTYGRFNFDSAKVVKWNCVFRIREKDGIAPGDYPFRMFVIVGDLATVTGSLRTLHREFGSH
ncbi:MAG: hypothetical protein JWL59_4216 [Chthoniobacteraceae bacterium]|nr:hypothetical protein [Chthoniobacteraceae bacterium]